MPHDHPEQTGARALSLLRIGRYEVADRIAAGGMATVHLGRQYGDAGFSRVVAVKRLLPQFCSDPEFEAMFIDEARLAARIQHPNVVSILDVVATSGELLLVMDYVHGESLWQLFSLARRAKEPVSFAVVTTVVLDALHGLHAAHEAKDRYGNPLHIVHRDVSPQNIIVGADGVARVLDFGIAKAADSVDLTQVGTVRGKAAYMAPEQLAGSGGTRRIDLFAVGVILWELLTMERLFGGNARTDIVKRLAGEIAKPSSRNPRVSPALDAVVMKALALEPEERFLDASEMASALQLACSTASRSEVVAWVEQHASERLIERALLTARVEASGSSMRPLAAEGSARLSRLSVEQDTAPPAEPAVPLPLPSLTLASRAPDSEDAVTCQYELGELADERSGERERPVSAAPSRWKETPVALVARPGRVRVLAIGGIALVLLAATVLSLSSEASDSEGEASANSEAMGIAAPDVPSEPTTASVQKLSVAVIEPQQAEPQQAEPQQAEPQQAEPQPPVEPHQVAELPPKAEPGTAAPKPMAAKTPPPKERTSRRVKKPRVNCSPPYTTDTAGRRHYKAECFK